MAESKPIHPITRRDFLGIVGNVISLSTIKFYLGNVVERAAKYTTHQTTENSVRSMFLSSADTVSPEWPDQYGWKKEVLDQYRNPLEIMQEAFQTCDRLGVTPKYILHGDILTVASMVSKISQNIDQGHPSDSITERVVALANNFAGYNNQRSDDLVFGYTRFSEFLRSLSPMKEQAYAQNPDASHFDMYKKYVKQIENLLNEIQPIVDSRKGKPLSMGQLAGYNIFRNHGDILAGYYETTALLQFLTRGQMNFSDISGQTHLRYSKINGKWVISEEENSQTGVKVATDNNNAPYFYEGTLVMSSLVQDQTSLVLPLDYLLKVANYDINKIQTLDLPLMKIVDNILAGKNTGIEKDKLQKMISTLQNTSIRNRAGGLYHFFSILVELAIFDPVIAQLSVDSYYGLHHLPDDLTMLSINTEHGPVKRACDLNTSSYLPEVSNQILQYSNTNFK